MQKISKSEFAATVLTNKYIPHKPTIKQAEFLAYSGRECMFGGSAGGGKTDSLLMAALMYVMEPDYSALILRRTYADLSLPGAVMDRANEWLRGTDAQWHDKSKTWMFPSGATVTFGYLETEVDKYRYQGAELQFCVGEGTQVLMGTGKYKKIDELCVGDEVETLDGPRKIKHVSHPMLKECVMCKVYDSNGRLIGNQVHSLDHCVLTPFGWQSFSSIYTLYGTLGPKQSHSDRISSSLVEQISRFLLQISLCHTANLQPLGRHLPYSRRLDRAEADACSTGDHSYCIMSVDEHPVTRQLPSLFFPAMLHEPPFLSSSLDRVFCANSNVQLTSSVADFQLNYLIDCNLRDELLLGPLDTCQDVAPLPNGAEQHTHLHDTLDDVDSILLRNPMAQCLYFHPYTGEPCFSESISFGSCYMTPVGVRRVYDVTVEYESHYITSSHLINKNCGFDELTQFGESQYQYLFSRLRKLEGSDIPLRIRATSNPGGQGHQWVRERFIISQAEDRLFIPAKLTDNPYLNQEEYIQSLQSLDPVTRSQLQDGNWDISAKGEMFQREWFEIVDQAPPCKIKVRYWDKAATEPTSKNPDPDYTVGLLLGEYNKEYYILDLVHFRKNPGDTDAIIEQTIKMDGPEVSQRMEEEPGSAGKSMIASYAKDMFKGYDFRGVRSTGSKIARAKPVSSASYNRLIKLVRAPWNSELLWELEMFPQDGVHDDICDSLSGAYNELNSRFEMNKNSLASLYKTKARSR